MQIEQDAVSDISLTGQGPDDVTKNSKKSKHELLEMKIILTSALMTTDRDSSFMIRNTSFTKQVHFYTCKAQFVPNRIGRIKFGSSTVID